MTHEEAQAILEKAAADPAHAARHPEIHAALGTHVPISAMGKPDNRPQDTVNADFRSKPSEGPLSSMARGVGAFADRAIDTATLGLYGKGLDWLQENVSPSLGSTASQRRNLPQIAGGAADALGYMSPLVEGAPARALAKGGAEMGDALLGAVARRRATSTAGKAAEKVASGAVGGAAANLAVGSGRGAITGEDQGSLWDQAKHGATLGAGMGVLAAGAGAGAAHMKAGSPDIQLLEQHGLEPRLPLPGPAVKPIEGHPSPMPVPEKVTPATRASAGTQAAEQVVPAIKAHEQANNREMGRQRGALYAGEGKDIGTVDPLLGHIDEAVKDPALPDASRTALGRLRDHVLKNSFATKDGRMLMRARDIDAMREYAEGLAGEIKTAQVKKGDIPLLGAARVARDLLTQTVSKPMVGPLQEAPPAAPDKPPLRHVALEDLPSKTQANPPGPNRGTISYPLAPGIADLNANYAKTAEGIARRYRLLGIKPPGTVPTEKTLEAAGRTITSRGEESKAAGGKVGAAGHRIDRLEAMGAQPEVLPGTTVPEFPDANRLMAQPQVQGAVERMQLSPPQAFNAAKSPSMLAHLAAAAPARTAYPALQALSKVKPGGNVVATDQLIHAIQKRKKHGLEARE